MAEYAVIAVILDGMVCTGSHRSVRHREDMGVKDTLPPGGNEWRIHRHPIMARLMSETMRQAAAADYAHELGFERPPAVPLVSRIDVALLPPP